MTLSQSRLHVQGFRLPIGKGTVQQVKKRSPEPKDVSEFWEDEVHPNPRIHLPSVRSILPGTLNERWEYLLVLSE